MRNYGRTFILQALTPVPVTVIEGQNLVQFPIDHATIKTKDPSLNRIDSFSKCSKLQ